jgi:sigma-B regulation protein RsbU (phosphoserine phosphatase)
VLFVLMLELKDKLLAHEELEAGRAVQAALLPSSNPEIPGWEVWLYTQSANEVGGDLVDYIKLDEERWGIALGDVAGKGLGAALFMAKLQATMRAFAPEFISLADLGKHMNAILCRDGIPNRFATFCYLELRSRSGRIRLLNAGHFPPILMRKQKLTRLDPLAMAFGVTTKTTYTEQSMSLEAGELLVIYSDGLTEAVNGTGEFFGEERLFRLLSSAPHTAAPDVGEMLLEEVKKFVGTAPASDDLSLVILRRLG